MGEMSEKGKSGGPQMQLMKNQTLYRRVSRFDASGRKTPMRS